MKGGWTDLKYVENSSHVGKKEFLKVKDVI